MAVYNVRWRGDLTLCWQEVDPERDPWPWPRTCNQERQRMSMVLIRRRPSGRPALRPFRFTLLLASKNSHIREGRIITKRGYDSKYSY